MIPYQAVPLIAKLGLVPAFDFKRGLLARLSTRLPFIEFVSTTMAAAAFSSGIASLLRAGLSARHAGHTKQKTNGFSFVLI